MVENRDFLYPLAFDTPVRGVSIGILPYRLVRKTIGWSGYPTVYAERLYDMFSRSDRIPRVTEGRTDRRTDIFLYGIVRIKPTRRAVKTVQDTAIVTTEDDYITCMRSVEWCHYWPAWLAIYKVRLKTHPDENCNLSEMA